MPPADTRRASRLVVETSACTFYLVFKEPAALPGALTAVSSFEFAALPISYISFRGTLQSYRAFTASSTLFSQALHFFSEAFRVQRRLRGRRTTAKPRLTVSGVPRAEVRLGSCELKEVSFDAARCALSERRSRSVHSIYALVGTLSTSADARNRLGLTCVTTCLTEL